MITALRRGRLIRGALLLLTVLAGLASRRFPAYQPSFVAQYAGDALWAAAVFWTVALLLPRAATGSVALISGAIACAVEVSQLSQVTWLESMRDTWAGALVLGHGFLWSDLVMYTIGVLAAVLIDISLRPRRT